MKNKKINECQTKPIASNKAMLNKNIGSEVNNSSPKLTDNKKKNPIVSKSYINNKLNLKLKR